MRKEELYSRESILKTNEQKKRRKFQHLRIFENIFLTFSFHLPHAFPEFSADIFSSNLRFCPHQENSESIERVGLTSIFYHRVGVESS
eukprot:UN20697